MGTIKKKPPGVARPAVHHTGRLPRGRSVLLFALLQRGAENVAERRARIGRAVLGDRLLLLGDFQRLDRNADLTRLLVELGNARIDLLADRKAFRTLLRPVAGELVALDEGRELGPDDLHVDA